jgi:hypothetical protein
MPSKYLQPRAEPRDKISWARLAGRFWLAITIVHVLAQVLVWLPSHTVAPNTASDWPIYHRAAQDAASGRSPYRAVPNYSPEIVPSTFLYPPPFAAMLAPLGNLSSTLFARLWFPLLLASFWTYAWCLARLSHGTPTWQAVLGWGALVQLMPGQVTMMSFGNAQPVINALWGLGLLGTAGGWRRGASLSLATLLKLQPLWALLIAFSAEKKSRLPAVVVGVLGVALGALVCGAHSYVDWWRTAMPQVNQGTFGPTNYSLSFAVLRALEVLGAWQYPGGPLAAGPRAFLSACAMAAPLAALGLSRGASVQMRCAFVGSAAIVFSPLCWDWYLPLLLPVLILWWRDLRSRGQTA